MKKLAAIPRCRWLARVRRASSCNLFATFCFIALAMLFSLAGCTLLSDNLEQKSSSEAVSDNRFAHVVPVAQTAEDDFSVDDAQAAPYEDRYYYNQLPEDQRHRYRMLYNTLIAHASRAFYPGEYRDDMQTVARSLFLDCPEFFYASMGGTYESDGTDTEYRVEYIYDTNQTYALRNEIEQGVADALGSVAAWVGLSSEEVPVTIMLNGEKTGRRPSAFDGTAQYQIAWAINEYLANTIAYHWDAAAASDEQFYETYYDTNTLYGALVQRHAMCGGYSQAYAYLCYQLGIPCVYVEGNVDSPDFTGAHAWDVVQIDGAWGVVDPTWSDDEQGIGLRDDYFLTTDDYHGQYVTELYVPADIPAA